MHRRGISKKLTGRYAEFKYLLFGLLVRHSAPVFLKDNQQLFCRLIIADPRLSKLAANII